MRRKLFAISRLFFFLSNDKRVTLGVRFTGNYLTADLSGLVMNISLFSRPSSGRTLWPTDRSRALASKHAAGWAWNMHESKHRALDNKSSHAADARPQRMRRLPLIDPFRLCRAPGDSDSSLHHKRHEILHIFNKSTQTLHFPLLESLIWHLDAQFESQVIDWGPNLKHRLKTLFSNPNHCLKS